MGQSISTGRNAALGLLDDTFLELITWRTESRLNEDISEFTHLLLSNALLFLHTEQHRRRFTPCLLEILNTVPLITKRKEISITCCLADLNALFDFFVSFDAIKNAEDDVLEMVLHQNDAIAESINVNFTPERQRDIATANYMISKELHQRKFRMCLDDLVMIAQFRQSDKPAQIQLWLGSSCKRSDDDVPE
ncbi:hypothetical protein HUJ04_012666 [Dendroctonus ponderosae]|uniref:Uncharacterized protein n=1 Tax=Dendroctonus ponderosae TaxID=77166 RepID=A0AAR5PVD6_DENPD|nr:hypothetical protein HUJ04_012666 [Dendroctonus ponderosae]